MGRTNQVRQPSRRPLPERDRLVMENYRLPFFMAQKMMGNPGVRRMGIEDAAGWGFLALVRAAEQWDPGRGVKFVSYASTAIWKEIWKAALNDSIVRVPPSSQRKKKIKPPAWAVVPDGVKHTSCGFVPENEPAARHDQDPELHDQVEAGFKCLTPRQREVVDLVCLQGLKGHEAAKRMDPPVTYQRVFQVRDDALAKLRKSFEAAGWE